MKTSGARLKEVRLKKGLTLEEAHKKTKIHTNILKAIEEGELAHMSPVYIKGFLKIYCHYLGVDPRECIPDYKEPQGTLRLSPRIDEGEGAAPLRRTPASFDLSFLKPFLTVKVLVAVITAVAVLWMLFGVGRFVAQRHAAHVLAAREAKQRAVPAAPVKKARTAALATAKQEKPAQSAVVAATPLPQQVVVTSVRLVIRAKADSYMLVKTDGHTVFQGVLKKTRSETWNAKDKIELNLGDAGALELEVNGRTIPPLGRKRQSLKNILITKEGLSVQ